MLPKEKGGMSTRAMRHETQVLIGHGLKEAGCGVNLEEPWWDMSQARYK